MINRLFYIVMTSTITLGCDNPVSSCNEGERRIKEWHGSIRIDSIFNDWRYHAQAATDKKGNKILFMPSNLAIPPQKGDSLYKDTGTVEYTLIRGDSIYVQKWDCLKRRHALFVGSRLKA